MKHIDLIYVGVIISPLPLSLPVGVSPSFCLSVCPVLWCCGDCGVRCQCFLLLSGLERKWRKRCEQHSADLGLKPCKSVPRKRLCVFFPSSYLGDLDSLVLMSTKCHFTTTAASGTPDPDHSLVLIMVNNNNDNT